METAHNPNFSRTRFILEGILGSGVASGIGSALLTAGVAHLSGRRYYKDLVRNAAIGGALIGGSIEGLRRLWLTRNMSKYASSNSDNNTFNRELLSKFKLGAGIVGTGLVTNLGAGKIFEYMLSRNKFNTPSFSENQVLKLRNILSVPESVSIANNPKNVFLYDPFFNVVNAPKPSVEVLSHELAHASSPFAKKMGKTLWPTLYGFSRAATIGPAGLIAGTLSAKLFKEEEKGKRIATIAGLPTLMSLPMILEETQANVRGFKAAKKLLKGKTKKTPFILSELTYLSLPLIGAGVGAITDTFARKILEPNKNYGGK